MRGDVGADEAADAQLDALEGVHGQVLRLVLHGRRHNAGVARAQRAASPCGAVLSDRDPPPREVPSTRTGLATSSTEDRERCSLETADSACVL